MALRRVRSRPFLLFFASPHQSLCAWRWARRSMAVAMHCWHSGHFSLWLVMKNHLIQWRWKAWPQRSLHTDTVQFGVQSSRQITHWWTSLFWISRTERVVVYHHILQTNINVSLHSHHNGIRTAIAISTAPNPITQRCPYVPSWIWIRNRVYPVPTADTPLCINFLYLRLTVSM